MEQTQTANGTVVGYFENHTDAQRAIEALHEAGFSSAHLGVAHRGESSTASGTAHAVGEKAEGMWEKVKHFFEGESAEPYADERTRGDLASHEITDDSNDTSQYEYGSSGLHNSLKDLSVPEDRARYMNHRFGSSDRGAVVTVKAQGRESEAESILTEFGADLGQNATDYDYSETSSATENQGTQNIQLLGEVLRVHKDRISRGEVRLRKEIVTENQSVQVPVTREELVIERRAVDGGTPSSGSIGESEEIRIPLSEERAAVDKSTVVREEVAVGKKPVEEVRDLSSEVRHEELIVDDQTRKAG
jgi:uncharacterized protein (TIGR02271 family)